MARQPLESAEFVDAFLESGRVTVADVDRLIKTRSPEGVRLEYKGGDWLAGTGRAERGKPARPGARLAAWTSSFANSAGGVLVVGVDTDGDDLPTEVNANTCGAFGADIDALRQKATDALRSLAARHVVPPRIEVVDHPGGLVLVIGVERAPELIPCEEPGGAPVYYVRTFDGTMALSDIVAADLLVGRRARPTVDASFVIEQGGMGPNASKLKVRMIIHNTGLVWIDGMRAGLLHEGGVDKTTDSEVPTSFLGALDIREPRRLVHMRMNEVNDRWGELPPFAEVTCAGQVDLPGTIGDFAMAAYVVARGHPPEWWQIRGAIVPGQPAQALAPERTVTRCRRERAVVAFEAVPRFGR